MIAPFAVGRSRILATRRRQDVEHVAGVLVRELLVLGNS